MTPEKLKDAFWQILTESTEVEWFRAEQAGLSERELPYGTIKLLTGPNRTNTFDEERFDVEGDKLMVNSVGQREFTVTLNYYGPQAHDKLIELRDRMTTTNFRYAMASVTLPLGFELALVEIATIQDLSALLQSDYEERAALDLIFRGSNCVREEMQSIDEIKDLRAKYENVAGETVLEETKTIEL